ncbi:MAG TPA: radical SAM protein [Methanoregulaceae archaeon]|nr:radical SAM protein [Methanoregulaceae archaeon]
MGWTELKTEVLAGGGCRIEGKLPPGVAARSTAGPGAGGAGAVFFSSGGRRVRVPLGTDGPAVLTVGADGSATLSCNGETMEGRVEAVGLHCPRQAFVTVSESCVYECAYCPVPQCRGPRKTVEEIVDLVGEIADSVDAIALTSGVAVSIEEEEEYVCRVVAALRRFDLPIGVSIFPAPTTPARLHALGVTEVKFNLEAATPELFAAHCPGLPYEAVWNALAASVPLFGRGHVFSNVIVGLGETDDELDACVDRLVGLGVVPVLRPLNPVAGCRGRARPTAKRLSRAARHLRSAFERAELDPSVALSMCGACTGCDLAAWRDL